ncbi:MAG: hypothetical protein ABFS42_03945 [Candidatus Krumholzibacteriota bacterium]
MILVVTGTCVVAPGVRAGTGMGTSNTAIIDTKPPVVTVDQLPEFSVFQGGDIVPFRWNNPSDDHPSSNIGSYWAVVRIDGETISATLYDPDLPNPGWDWVVPETSSANVHLDVGVRDAFGNTTHETTNSFTILSSATDVPAKRGRLNLAAPAPNPFNPSTRLRFHLPETGLVDLTVFDARGHRIRNLVNEVRAQGEFEARWDGRDDRGRAQSGGIYLFVLEFRGSRHSGRMSQKAMLVP